MKQNKAVKRSLGLSLAIFILVLITIQVLAIIFSFFSYKDDSMETLYYNKIRVLCSDELNKITSDFYTGNYNYGDWNYPYVVIDNRGNVLYASGKLNIQGKVNIESFLQFDKSSEYHYSGYVKSSFPIVLNGENKGFFIAFIDKSALQTQSLLQRKIKLITPMLLSLALSLLLLLIYRIYFSRKVLSPLVDITQSSSDIVKGKLDTYVRYNSKTEIGELSYAFELMRDELKNHRDREETLKKAQKEIIAAISHDLKTPLSSIRLYVEAIRDGMAEKLEDREEYTSIILSKVDTLNKLIEDLLEHSKASLGELTINKKEIDIRVFLDDILSEISMELLSVNGNLYYDEDPPDGIINIDKLRISQVIFNLISNAIKYSDGDLIIKFKSEIKNKYLFIYIEDNGLGILQEDLPYIFNKFYRGDKSRNSRIPGSGLGLSTCKYIIEKHQGEIYCKNTDGKGCIFYFSIPLS